MGSQIIQNLRLREYAPIRPHQHVVVGIDLSELLQVVFPEGAVEVFTVCAPHFLGCDVHGPTFRWTLNRPLVPNRLCPFPVRTAPPFRGSRCHRGPKLPDCSYFRGRRRARGRSDQSTESIAPAANSPEHSSIAWIKASDLDFPRILAYTL